MNKNIKQDIIDRTLLLNKYAQEYYSYGESGISDESYDKLLDDLEKLENESDFRLENSPTKKVGFKILEGKKEYKLPMKLLSLNKIKNDKEKLKQWMGNKGCIASGKGDGLTTELIYEKGILVAASTRGNGEVGQDITDMVKTLQSVPLIFNKEIDIIISGEMIIRKNTLDRLNKNLPDDKKYKNCRNLASGTLTALDTSLGKLRGLEFLSFDCNKNIDKIKRFELLEELGFLTMPYKEIDKESINSSFDTLLNELNSLSIPYDGMVITYNDINVQKDCKDTSKYPTHSIAFKFQEELEETKLKGIEWSISRNGILTPVAIFNPAILDGTEVSRASCHNISIFNDLKLGINDSIMVKKANEIIPQIHENITKSGTCEIPKICPYCEHELQQEKEVNTTILKCINPKCLEKEVLKYTYIFSKPCLNAKGVDYSTIKMLMNKNIINSIKDIFELPFKQLELINMNLPGFKKRSITNLCNAIEKSKMTTLDRVINCFGIEGVGTSLSKVLSMKYGNINTFLNTTQKELCTIEGVSTVTADKIISFISNSKDEINTLLYFLDIKTVEDNKVNDVLRDMTFVITGSLSKFKNRAELEAYIVSRGGKISNKVNKSTTYLINNDKESLSSKNKRAKEINIKIITEEEFSNIIK